MRAIRTCLSPRLERWVRAFAVLFVAFASVGEAAAVVAEDSLPESFDRFRQIYFYQSQAAELLPPTFRPIDIDELDQRLRGLGDGQSLQPTDAPQLIRGVYVARLEKDRLVSAQSYWDIAYRGSEPARLSLGRLGLALRPDPGDAQHENAGQIVSDLSGENSVVVKGDSRLGFAWTASGQSIDRGIAFDLKIPPSMQTRILVEVPKDVRLVAVDGVGRRLPSPPPEAGPPPALIDAPAVPTVWYSIDAGGLSRLRLRLVNGDRAALEAVLPIRQISVQHDLLPQSIRFTARLLVDSPASSVLPVLAIHQGRVTSVRIGGSVVPWTEVTTPEGVGVRIDTSRLDTSSGNGTINIAVEGEAPWNSGGKLQPLPWPQWLGCRPILVATEMQAQVRLDKSLSALRLQLPSQWRFSPTATSEDGSRLFRCFGPLVSDGLAVMVRPDEKQVSADSVLRLMATTSQFQAQLDTSIAVSDVGPQPVIFNMDGNWSANLVTLPRSGRVIDLPSDPVERKKIAIWPTADELVDRRLQVRITGSMPIRMVGDRIEFPATAFATIENCRSRVAALITPPAGFNWTGDVALRTTRVTPNQLSSLQQPMVGELAEDSLLIEVNEGRIAPLVCRRPDISFDATSRFCLRLEGERLVETYLVACDSVSTEIQTIVVDLGEANGRPPMQWSALRVDGSSRRIASATLIGADDLVPRESGAAEPTSDSRASVADTDAKGREVWRLELGDTGERAVMLVGRREYGFSGRKQIPLPMVPGASNQSAQAVVMPSLTVTQLGDSVLKVPPWLSPKSRIRQYGAVPAESDPVAGAVVLRYDASEKASIELSSSHKVAASPLIWRETVRITASNRGGDMVTASYDIARSPTLVIDHEVNLRLVSVVDQDGSPIEYEADPTVLRIKTSDSVSRVVTTWTRSIFSGSIARQWTAPRMNAMGVVLCRDWEMMPAPDTLAPAALFSGTSTRLFPALLRTAAIEPAPDRPVGIRDQRQGRPTATALGITPNTGHAWVVDASVGYAMASMIGLCMFAFGWWLAARSPFVAAIMWICTIVPPLFLFATSTLWSTIVCAPIATGGLIGMTLTTGVKRWSHASDGSGFGPRSPANSPLYREFGELHHGSSRTGKSSWTGRFPLWLLALSIATAASTAGQRLLAQSPTVSPSSTESPPSSDSAPPSSPAGPSPSPVAEVKQPILVPTDAAGDRAGTKVYVPSALFENLFRERLPDATLLRVRSASYRLRLTGITAAESTAELEARYRLDDSTQRTEVRLPLRASQLRSVLWLTDTDSRPLRWSPDGEDAVRLNLPAASRASLLIRIDYELKAPSRNARRIQFPIPPIANATLVVDAGFAVQRFDLAESVGEIDAQPEVGRLNAAIGAVDAVDLTITYREAARTPVSIAQRRYWVHAGYERTNIECEIDLSDSSVRKGTMVPLVLLDGDPPIVMTNDWTIASTETLSPVRRQLTMQAQRDNPGPVRFLWELDSVIASTTTTEDPVPVVIPEIVSAGAAVSPPAVIALDAAQGLRLVPRVSQPMPDELAGGGDESALASDLLSSDDIALVAPPADAVPQTTTSPETIDAFISSWKGFRGTASEIITSATPLTRFIVVAAAPKPWQAEEVHHLHVRPGELQLSYAATITPGDRHIEPLRIVLPSKGELRVLTVNDAAINSVPHVIGNRREISIAAPLGPDAIRLRVVVHMRVSQNSQFTPPLISTEPISSVKGTYTLSRDQSLLVEKVVDGGLPEAESPAMGTDQQLTGGWVPCWTWRIDGVTPPQPNEIRRPQLPGKFRVLSRDVAISSQQRTSLIWDQTRWSVETWLRLKGSEHSRGGGRSRREPIDFVNVELPTIWCENLTVEPAETWSRQPSIDPATQIVRIRPQPTAASDGVITLRLYGQRSVDSDARLEVPSVRVLGSGKRDVFVTVPRRIDGREIAWEAIAALTARLPEELLRAPQSILPKDSNAQSGLTPFRPNDHLVFRSVSGNTSVRLAPSRLEVTSPRVTMADIQLFAGSGRQTNMIYRWDLCPGRDEQVTIDLPPDLKPVEVRIDDEPANWTARDSRVDVTLALSRLAQSITLVGRLDAVGSDPKIARLRGIPVDQTWMTVYESAAESATVSASVHLADRWQGATVEERLLAQARSIREVTEASLSRATDRSQEEIVQWVLPWDQRFRGLAKRAASDPFPSSSEADETTPWGEQVEKWQQYLRRVAGEPVLASGDRSMAWVPPDPWRAVSVARHEGQAETLPGIRVIATTKNLATVIQTVLILIITFGLALLMWRGRYYAAPLASNPASWMFATGLASLAVAPVPVALAICGVALTAPLLHPRRSLRH